MNSKKDLFSPRPYLNCWLKLRLWLLPRCVATDFLYSNAWWSGDLAVVVSIAATSDMALGYNIHCINMWRKHNLALWMLKTFNFSTDSSECHSLILRVMHNRGSKNTCRWLGICFHCCPRHTMGEILSQQLSTGQYHWPVMSIHVLWLTGVGQSGNGFIGGAWCMCLMHVHAVFTLPIMDHNLDGQARSVSLQKEGCFHWVERSMLANQSQHSKGNWEVRWSKISTCFNEVQLLFLILLSEPWR